MTERSNNRTTGEDRKQLASQFPSRQDLGEGAVIEFSGYFDAETEDGILLSPWPGGSDSSGVKASYLRPRQ